MLVFSKRQNLMIISLFFLIIIGLYVDTVAFQIAFWWCLFILLNGNIKRLWNDKSKLYVIRLTMYFFPYMIPSIFFTKQKMLHEFNIIYLILALFFGGIIHVFEKNKWKIEFSKYNLAQVKKKPQLTWILRCYCLIGTTIAEELFFRYYLLTQSRNYFLLFAFIGLILFVLNHYIVLWGDNFRKTDYIRQIYVGLVASALFYSSKSIIPSILFHLIFNAFSIAQIVMAFIRHYILKSYYDGIENEEEFLIEI